MAEQSEQRTPAATHCRIGGTQLIESLFDGCEFGVEGEDTLLEIIDQFLFPCFYGLHDNITATLLRKIWLDACKCFFGRYGDVGSYDSHIPAAQVNVHGIEFLTDTLSIGGTVEDEDGTVCPQFGCVADQFLITEVQLE